MKDDVIHVEEEFKDLVAQAEDTGRRRYEEFSVRGADLKDTLGRLAQEARVRKITLRSRTGKTLAEIPMVLGAAGVLIIGPWTAVLLAAAWLTRVSILIEYEDAPSAIEESTRSAVDQIEARIA
ncbi:MAG: DUF4342 domain-containing protein [Anaerolineae bacterium]|uniref:DUF4342 domain-containing protein n=1 Tax=Promineifilum sp. TaxID=2664178 RepID=UPI001DA2088D|nr:DUF4342 domain-containing protein [Anaerolineales bacterium]MCB8936089.1 DUF4342 domain-containing protein [Promineifilum sp.]MCO5181709.1 DUF4342 domain-containing protein [Promineifilum sp.]MCW5847816.1 DUF4342 domain-containing protein [Anaerolineae bacterium]